MSRPLHALVLPAAASASSRTITEEDAVRLIARAIALVESLRPVPSHVTLSQAAEMLGMSRVTARKLNLPRNRAGRIPYSAVLEILAVSR